MLFVDRNLVIEEIAPTAFDCQDLSKEVRTALSAEIKLDCPPARRILGDVEVQKAPTVTTYDEKTQRTANLTVGTVKKSIAAIASR